DFPRCNWSLLFIQCTRTTNIIYMLYRYSFNDFKHTSYIFTAAYMALSHTIRFYAFFPSLVIVNIVQRAVNNLSFPYCLYIFAISALDRKSVVSGKLLVVGRA